MKVRPAICALIALLVSGCAALRPALRGPDGAKPGAPAALWLPTGYEQLLRPQHGQSPPGSLAEAMEQRADERVSPRRFAASFPDCAADVLAYHQQWRDYMSSHVGPLLRGQPLHDGWLDSLAAQLDALDAEQTYLDTAGPLHHALEHAQEPRSRERLQALLTVHETQRLRAMAILQLAHAKTAREAAEAATAARQLREFRSMVPPRLQAWTQAQLVDEKRTGDLAGNDWGSLFADTRPLQALAGSGVLVLPDPEDAGVARKWSSALPDNGQGSLKAQWDVPVDLAADCGIVWLYTELILPPEPPAALFLSLRGFRGTVSVFVDGVLLGAHSEADDGRVSWRLSLDSLHAGAAPRRLVFRIERPPEGRNAPATWHTPWLSIRAGE